jgi:hypothetical protein
MFESHQVDLLFPDGTRRTMTLDVYIPDDGETYEVALDLDDSLVVGRSKRGVFFALQEMRRLLDERSILIDCYGASENVYPSGMIADMGDVAMAYRMTLGKPARRVDLVDVFARGPDTKPASVSAQEQFVARWRAYFDRGSKEHKSE